MPAKHEKHLKRLRRICESLPGTYEKNSRTANRLSFAKKVFAMCSFNHHNDGHVAVVVPAPPGIQAMLIENEPDKYYKPPYVGGAGWIGIELNRVSDEESSFIFAKPGD